VCLSWAVSNPFRNLISEPSALIVQRPSRVVDRWLNTGNRAETRPNGDANEVDGDQLGSIRNDVDI